MNDLRHRIGRVTAAELRGDSNKSMITKSLLSLKHMLHDCMISCTPPPHDSQIRKNRAQSEILKILPACGMAIRIGAHGP